jgi:hypothetical protein
MRALKGETIEAVCVQKCFGEYVFGDGRQGVEAAGGVERKIEPKAPGIFATSAVTCG